MVSKSLFKKGIFLAMITLLIAEFSYGQESTPKDSIQILPSVDVLNLSPPVINELSTDGYKILSDSSISVFKSPSLSYKFSTLYYPDFHTDKTLLHKGEYNVSGIIKGYRNSAIYGFGEQTNLIGVGIMNQASFGYYHYLNDNLSMNVQLHAAKMSGPYFTNQLFGTSGDISYQLNDRIGINIFGSYSISPTTSFRAYQYGGSMSIDVTERFGTELGVRRYYDSVYGRWETIPIIAPYYKFKKFKLEMDVGPILQHVIYNLVK